MKMYRSIVLALILLSVACNKTKEEPQPQATNCSGSYSMDLQPVINSKCAISGCHDGNSNLVALNNYENLKSRADNGRIKEFVLDKGIMPPASATQLTQEEKDVFKCWLDNDAPKD